MEVPSRHHGCFNTKSWSMTCMIKGNVNPGLINPVYGRLIGRLQLKHQMIHDWRRNPPFINQGLLLRGSHYAHDFGIHVPVGHQPLELQGAMPIHDGGAGGTSSVSLWPRGLDKGGGEKGLDKLGKFMWKLFWNLYWTIEKHLWFLWKNRTMSIVLGNCEISMETLFTFWMITLDISKWKHVLFARQVQWKHVVMCWVPIGG